MLPVLDVVVVGLDESLVNYLYAPELEPSHKLHIALVY